MDPRVYVFGFENSIWKSLLQKVDLKNVPRDQEVLKKGLDLRLKKGYLLTTDK